MKVFISWSGDSKDVASALLEVLPRLFDDADPFMSTEIRAGSIWLLELERHLSETDFGIICLTNSNSRSRWLHYEAGALSRRVGSKREAMPVMLIDTESPLDVGGPFAGFQLKTATQAGFLEIVKSLNRLSSGGRKPVAEDILTERVAAHWKRIEDAIIATRSQSVVSDKRDENSMLREILQIVRSLGVSSGLGYIDESALSEGISSRILKKLSTTDGEDGSWPRFDQAVRELAERLRQSYEPDFMVGVYPEGGFVGYLLWLDSDRRWPFFLAPDAESPPLEEELADLAAKISRACEGKVSPKGLVVDLAMKSGRTMARTVDMVLQACNQFDGEVEVRTLCLSVKEGYALDDEKRPDFVGMDAVDFLLGEQVRK